MIDFHTHVGDRRGIDAALRHADVHGVELSVLLPIEPGMSSAAGTSAAMSTRKAIEAHQAHPSETAAFCHVDPLTPDATDRLRSLREAGVARGFGEHKTRLPIDHPRNMDIYRLCGEFGWPVLLHMDYTGVYGARFEALGDVASACPETVFIGHAMSWWSNVSAEVVTDPDSPDFSDYPMGEVVPVGLTDRLLSERPNVYGDLSARSGYFALYRDPAFARDFLRRHRRKLVWGSDCPCVDGRGGFPNGTFRACLAEITLGLLRDYCETQEQFEDITHGNGARLLELAED